MRSTTAFVRKSKRWLPLFAHFMFIFLRWSLSRGLESFCPRSRSRRWRAASDVGRLIWAASRGGGTRRCRTPGRRGMFRVSPAGARDPVGVPAPARPDDAASRAGAEARRAAVVAFHDRGSPCREPDIARGGGATEAAPSGTDAATRPGMPGKAGERSRRRGTAEATGRGRGRRACKAAAPSTPRGPPGPRRAPRGRRAPRTNGPCTGRCAPRRTGGAQSDPRVEAVLPHRSEGSGARPWRAGGGPETRNRLTRDAATHKPARGAHARCCLRRRSEPESQG